MCFEFVRENLLFLVISLLCLTFASLFLRKIRVICKIMLVFVIVMMVMLALWNLGFEYQFLYMLFADVSVMKTIIEQILVLIMRFNLQSIRCFNIVDAWFELITIIHMSGVIFIAIELAISIISPKIKMPVLSLDDIETSDIYVDDYHYNLNYRHIFLFNAVLRC